MRRKKIISLLKAAAVVLCIAGIAFLCYIAILHGVVSGGDEPGNGKVAKEYRTSRKAEESRPEEPPQVAVETAGTRSGVNGPAPYIRYDLAGNIERDSDEGKRAAAASAFGKWLWETACMGNAPEIEGMMNTGAVEAKGYEADLGAASAKVIEDWKDKGREVLYVGHYYGGAGEYVARYCLVRQREGAAEQEYELENASLHELTLYFDETGMVYAFLPFPAQAVSGYGRLYGIQRPRPSGSSDKKEK